MTQHRLAVSALALAACLSLSGPALAQPDTPRRRGGGGGAFSGQFGGAFGGQFGGAGALGPIGRDEVQQELALSEDQKTRIGELSGKLRQQQRDLFRGFRDLSEEEREAQQAQSRQSRDQELATILTDAQRQRLQQIELQETGPSALLERARAKELGMSEEQAGQMRQIAEQARVEGQALRDQMRSEFTAFGGGFSAEGVDRDAMRARGEAMRARFEEINSRRDQRILAVLTDQQRSAWTAKLGAPVKSAAVGGVGNGLPAPAPDSTRAAAAQPLVDPVTNERLLRFNFRFHPWPDVLDWFAQQAGLSLHADTKPTGTCNYTDPAGYTPTQALDLLNVLLIPKGHILIRKGNLLICWELQNPIPPSLLPEVTLAELDKRGENELVSVKVPLQRLVAEETVKQMEALKGPFGKVVAVPAGNLLVITDTAGNVRRMRDVLQIDQVAEEGGLRVFPLRYTQATEVAGQLRQLLGLPSTEAPQQVQGGPQRFGRGAFPDFRNAWANLARQQQREQAPAARAVAQAQVVADTRTNSVLVAAPADQLALAEAAIQKLDVPLGGQGGPLNASQVVSYPLTRSDPTTVLTLLKELLASDPNVRLSADTRSGSLYAVAPPMQQATIRALVNEMEGISTSSLAGGRTHRIIPVGPRSAEQLAEMLRRVWQQTGKENPVVIVPAGSSAPNGTRRIFAPGSRPAAASGDGEARASSPQRPAAAEGRAPSELRPSSGADAGTSRREPPRVDPPAPDAASPASPPGLFRPGRRPRQQLPRRTPVAEADASSERERLLAAAAQPADGAAVIEAAFAQNAVRVGEEAGAQDGSPRAAANGAAQAQTPSEENPAAQSEAPKAEAKVEKPPVVITPGPGVLTIESQDEDALRLIEQLANAVAQPTGQAPFYWIPLYEAEAAEVAQTIQQVLTAGASAQAPAIASAGLRVVPDARVNALLVVGANAGDLLTLDQLVQVLDTADLPETSLKGQPQLIRVQHTSATEVANVLREVYADQISGGGVSAGGRPGDTPRFNPNDPRSFFLAARMQGLGGPAAGNNSRDNTRRPSTVRLSLGVDSRTNTIVVSAPPALFDEIEALVRSLDEAAQQSNRTMRVIPVRYSNLTSTQQTLGLMLGSQVQGSGQGARNGGTVGVPSFPGFSEAGMPRSFRPGADEAGLRGNDSSRRNNSGTRDSQGPRDTGGRRGSQGRGQGGR